MPNKKLEIRKVKKNSDLFKKVIKAVGTPLCDACAKKTKLFAKKSWAWVSFIDDVSYEALCDKCFEGRRQYYIDEGFTIHEDINYKGKEILGGTTFVIEGDDADLVKEMADIMEDAGLKKIK